MSKTEPTAQPKRQREGTIKVVITRSVDPVRAERLYALMRETAAKGAAREAAEKEAA